MDNPNLRDEYIDVSNNIRHFQTIRFAQHTIVIAITAGLLNVLYSKSESLPPRAGLGIKIAGILISFLYWILQERTMLYWNHFLRRAAELESELGFGQYKLRPRAGIITGANTMRAFFFVLILFWTAALIWFR